MGQRGRADPHRCRTRPRRTRRASRGDPDGADLRQSRRSGRQSRSAAVGARHQGDFRAHGDEPRGDRRADGWRAYLRQGAWQWRCQPARRCSRGRGPRIARLRLDQQPRERRHRRTHGDERDRRLVGQYAYRVVGELLPAAARLRVRTGQKPGGRAPVAADRPEAGGYGSGIVGPVGQGADDDDHRRHGAQDGPRIPGDQSRSSAPITGRSRMPSPAHGSSCATATWGRRSAISAPRCPPKT